MTLNLSFVPALLMMFGGLVPLPVLAQDDVGGDWLGKLHCTSATMKMTMRLTERAPGRFSGHVMALTPVGRGQLMSFEWTTEGTFDSALGEMSFARERWRRKGMIDTSTFTMRAMVASDRSRMRGSMRLHNCRAFELERQAPTDRSRLKAARPATPLSRGRRVAPSEEVLAEFHESGRWSFTGGNVRARVVRLDGRETRLKLEADSSSGAFKYFAEPHGVLLLADAQGRIVARESVVGLAMRMSTSGVFTKRTTRNGFVPADAFRAATYAFFRFKYCGWQQTFERNVGSSNGCAKSDLDDETKIFAAGLRDALPAVRAAPGQAFEVMGWRGMRLSSQVH